MINICAPIIQKSDKTHPEKTRSEDIGYKSNEINTPHTIEALIDFTKNII